jgi:hypothetical protein
MLGTDTYYVHRRGQLAGHLTLKIRDSKYILNLKKYNQIVQVQQPKQNKLDVNNESCDILHILPSRETT